MKNIVIIQQEPLTKRTRDIFAINELLNAGFNLEYWNMSQYFNPGLSLFDEVKENYCFDVNSIEILNKRLQNTDIKNTVFIIETFDNWENRGFFKLLKKFECFTIKMELYATANISVNRLYRFMRENFNGKIRMIKSYSSSKLYVLYKLINHFNTYNVEISSNPRLNCKESVFINHPDYEQSRICSQRPSLINSKYAVFLDEYFPLHPDLKYFLKKINFGEIDSSIYLKIMCSFFERIEQQFGVQIVIAAHPKSNYTEADFANRPVLKYVTGQLIQFAQFAILHSSTAIAFATICYCPLLICFTKDYKKGRILYELAYKYSKIFKAPFIQVEDHVDSLLPTPYIDYEACDNFKYTYLTRPEIEKKENKDIIIQYIKNL